MTPFMSAERDFISLFAAEPRLLDAGVPWVYNNVSFDTALGADRVGFAMCPSYGECTFRWEREGVLWVRLELNGVVSFEVREDAKQGLLLLTFRDTERGRLSLHLRPAVRVEWRRS